MQRIVLFFLLLSSAFLHAQAQDMARVEGLLRDSLGNLLPGVSVGIVGYTNGTSSNEKGFYSLEIPANVNVQIAFSFIGFKTEYINLSLAKKKVKNLNVVLKSTLTELPGIVIKDELQSGASMSKIDPKLVNILPNASGNFESILKTLPGVVSNNELSSQYNVRGGNFDENLVYVNDIEIYRPFLVRTGQQEGLSFINSDMVESVNFSAGGFEARYGDKLSSVLDIKYRRPKEFAGTVLTGLQGTNITLEGTSLNRRLSFMGGFRYKTNQYVLNSLDTKGSYRPNFTDYQSLISYAITDKWDLEFLANYSQNQYQIVPKDRETVFGTVNQALKLRVYFEGQEIDTYETYLGALATTIRPSNNLKLRFIASAYQTHQSESFDILGQYYLEELERDFGSSKVGQSVATLGIGSFLNHARNVMDGFVYNLEHKAYYTSGNNYWQWGLKYQHEGFTDKVKEWTMTDSADFVIPKDPSHYYPDNAKNPLVLSNVLNNKSEFENFRLSAYIQNNIRIGSGNSKLLTLGVRSNYMNLSGQLLFSPRATFSYRPTWNNNLQLRASAGVYQQPPFYREYRDLYGNINLGLKAQQSIHFVLGSDYFFKAFDKNLKLVSEAYYKYLSDLIPYKIDNVRVRYLGNNSAKGYATGVDFRLNGEFVKGLESWFSVSLMQTKEDLQNDYYYNYYNKAGEQIIPGYTFDSKAVDSTRVNPGYIPRPADQRVTFAILFQDYLPKFPSFRVYLNLVYGSGLPAGPPGNDRYKDILRLPSYRRVDIGFSKVFFDEKFPNTISRGPVKYLKTAWLSFEVFNVLQVDNTSSYLWVKDISNRQYAIPNYLTARTVNLKLVLKF